MSKEVTISTATYSVFAPTLLLTKACCVFPVRIRTLDENTKISWSWTYCGLSLGAFVGIMTWIAIGQIKNYAIEDVYSIRLAHFSAKIVTILDVSYLLLTFTLATFLIPFTFKHLCSYLSCLNKVDYLLRRPAREEKKKYMVVLFMTLTLVVLGVDIKVWFNHVFSKHISLWTFLLRSIPLYFTYFLVMVIETNYWYLVQMINVRLAKLNDNLAEKYNHCKSNSNEYQMGEPLRDGNNFSLVIEIPMDMFSINIFDIIKVYELLSEANCAVNDYFGLNMLLLMIGCLINLLVTPYYLYIQLKFHDYAFVLSQSCWMVAHIIRLLLVVEPCHTTVQTVKRTSTLVCQFLSLDLPQQLHSQVEILATQLSHCPLQYTAYDLVTLDRPLLTAITGGVTTYLIILFQSGN